VVEARRLKAAVVDRMPHLMKDVRDLTLRKSSKMVKISDMTAS
jgi:hypothetical protein